MTNLLKEDTEKTMFHLKDSKFFKFAYKLQKEFNAKHSLSLNLYTEIVKQLRSIAIRLKIKLYKSESFSKSTYKCYLELILEEYYYVNLNAANNFICLSIEEYFWILEE